MADNIGNDSSNATILAALDASVAAYYLGTSDLTKNAQYMQLTEGGWIPIDAVALPIDSAQDTYVGVAFYKVVNGVTEVLIANRGSQTEHDFLVSDAELALNGVPHADVDALAYYNAVVEWASNSANTGNVTNGVAGPVNVIETGHSLGGQEADFVQAEVAGHLDAAASVTPPTEAISFDAPGQSTTTVTVGATYDALNISLSNEGVHSGGSALNAGYLGNSVTISGGVNGAAIALVGAAINPLLGLLGWFYTTFVYDHKTGRLSSYFAQKPALGGVDLQTYSPTQVTQPVVDGLATISAPVYESSSNPAQLIANVFAQQGGSSSSTSSNGALESFTGTSNSDGFTLQGSEQDSISATISGNQETLTDNFGNKLVLNFNSDGTALTSASTSFGDPTTSTTSFNADGSSSTKVTYESGAYATVTDDGQGNITTDYFTTNGIETGSTWVHSDGSSGRVETYEDGVTRTSGSGGNSVTESASYIFQNPDGSYINTGWNTQDASVSTSYNGNGSESGQSTAVGPGVNDLAVASTSNAYNGGIEFTSNYNSAGTFVGGTWYSANSNGTINPAGVYVDWTKTNCTSGTETVNASGVFVNNDLALDGTSYRNIVELNGTTVSHYDSTGVLLSDQWSDSDGSNATPSVNGSDSFNADGSGTGTFVDSRDGTSGTVALDGQGSIVIVNTNASGTVTSKDTWNSDGSFDIAMFDASGATQAIYDYLANGNVTVTDLAADGKTADQQTVAGGLVVNPDGSSFSKVVNADGSYTVYYQDAQGDTTAYQYSAAGQLSGSYHTTSNDSPHAEWTGNLPNGQAWTGTLNAYTPTYTDAQGNAWTIYLNAAGVETGADYVNAATGAHGHAVYGTDNAISEVDYAADGSSTDYMTDGKGNVETSLYDANGRETGDTWQGANGTRGNDSFNADGSSLGTVVNADGSYSTYTDDGVGDVTTQFFSAAGVLAADHWTKATGSSGTDTFNADGSSSGTITNADGSYATYSRSTAGLIATNTYSSTGVLLGSTTQSTDTAGDLITSSYSGAGTLLGKSWTNPDGSHGSDAYNADGSYSASAADSQGNTSTSQYSSTDVLLSDTWQDVDGRHGNDIYNANGSHTSISDNRDGSYSQTTVDASGNSLTDYYNATGQLIGDAWTHADGTSGRDNLSGVPTSANADFRKDGVYAINSRQDDQPSAQLTDTVYDAQGQALYSIDIGLQDLNYNTGEYGGTVGDTGGVPDYQITSVGQAAEASDGTQVFQDVLGDGLNGQWHYGIIADESMVLADGTLLSNLWNTDLLAGQTLVATSGGPGTGAPSRTSPAYEYIVPVQDGFLISNSATGLVTFYDGASGVTYATAGQNPGLVVVPLGDQTSTSNGGSANNYTQTWTYSGGAVKNMVVANGGVVAYSANDGHGGSSYTDYVSLPGGEVWGETNDAGYSSSSREDQFLAQPFWDSQFLYPDGTVAQESHYGSEVLRDPSGVVASVTYGTTVNSSTTAAQTRVADLNGDTITTQYNSTAPYYAVAASAMATSTWTTADGTQVSATFDLLTGASTEQLSYTDGNSSMVSSDAGGGYIALNYDVSGRLVGDQWQDDSGNTGTDVFNADGSKSGNETYATGQTSTYANDGQGNVTTQYYNSAGALTGDNWTKANGTSGTDTFNADGSSSGRVVKADGSYSAYTNDGKGDVTTQYYTAAGILTSDSWVKANGTSGTDTFFEYNPGSGAEVISVAPPASATSANVLGFGAGITPSSLTLGAATGKELVLLTGGSGDSVSIEGFNPLNPLQSFPIQSFDFSDGTKLTLQQLLSDKSVTGSSGSFTNADGSVTSYDFTPSATQIYYAQNVNASGVATATAAMGSDGSSNSYTYNTAGQTLTANVTNADGSTSDSTFVYNADGSSTEATVATPAGDGAATTTIEGHDANGNLISMQIQNPDGSHDSYTYNSAGQSLTADVANADGSATDSSFVYGADGSYTETTVVTPTGGGASTTTTDGYDASGDLVSMQIQNPDGSSDSYTYNSAGQTLTADVTSADGSTNDSTFAYNADGTYTDTVVSTPAGGGNSTTTVYDYNSQGNLSNENAYTTNPSGSYIDTWSQADGSHGTYWWDTSTLEYEATWYNSNGSSWTDEYQYASGGAPGAAGYSFDESFSASDGSQGTRQYNATTGAITLNWDSTTTGQLSGTTTDAGFMGLQNQGELTSSQQEPTFFNPNVSPGFQAFLAAH